MRHLAAVGLFSIACAVRPSWANDNAFHRDLAGEWGRQLESHESTLTHAAYLRDARVELRFVSAGADLLPSEIARFDGALFVNSDYLSAAAAALVKQGVPEALAVPVTALKTLHVIAHELCHGMVKAQMRRQGLDFDASSVEEETLCHVDTARVLRELEAKQPFLKNYRLNGLDGRPILEASGGGVAGIERWVRQDGELLSFASDPRERWIERYNEFAQTQQTNLDNIDRFRRIRDITTDKGLAGMLDSQLARYHPDGHYRERAAQYRRVAAAAADADKFERLRRFYAERLQQAGE